MVELQAAQFVPPVDADEDALDQVINNGIRTEFHPSGTLAMLPLDQGGVVDSHLLVWGMSCNSRPYCHQIGLEDSLVATEYSLYPSKPSQDPNFCRKEALLTTQLV